MDMRYIAAICFGAVALFLCFFAAFAKREKVKAYILCRGLASFSCIVLALVCCNTVYHTDAYSLFIICGLAAFMLSAILKSLPTKTDMFRLLYTLVDSISFAFLTISLVFVSSISLINLIVAGVLFVVLMIVYLTIKKSHQTREKLATLLFLLVFSALMGFAINFFLAFNLKSILFLSGSVLCLIYSILQIFTTSENKKAAIVKNIFLDIALITFAASILF